MLSKYIIIPGSFNDNNGSSPVALNSAIGCLKELCGNEGLFMDLREGGWSGFVGSLNNKSRIFLEHAKKRHRIISTPSQLPCEPDDDDSWLFEAQAYHKKDSCKAIIVPPQIAELNNTDPVVSNIENMSCTEWWQQRSPSSNIERCTKAYKHALKLVLRHANRLCFIDPYIDPFADNYKEFIDLLLAAGTNTYKPKIEIHKINKRKVHKETNVLGPSRWKQEFDDWSKSLMRAGIGADVHIWKEFHDRYLITDIIGISMPHGFDISSKSNDFTTWCRLGEVSRERVEKEHDPSCDLDNRYIDTFHIGQ